MSDYWSSSKAPLLMKQMLSALNKEPNSVMHKERRRTFQAFFRLNEETLFMLLRKQRRQYTFYYHGNKSLSEVATQSGGLLGVTGAFCSHSNTLWSHHYHFQRPL